jgi:hypothetical protein
MKKGLILAGIIVVIVAVGIVFGADLVPLHAYAQDPKPG